MISILRTFLLPIFLTAFVVSCGPDALYNLSNESYPLRDTDSTLVNFPDDYKGDISVISFIFTSCPDVCPLITANMTNIQNELQDTSGVNFVEITFDPERDTPSELREYKELYGLNEQFSLLTAEPEILHPLLERLDIVAEKTFPDSVNQDSSNYNIRHSNIIYLMDESGYIRAEYPAHRVPPEHVTQDIQTLRKE